MAVNRTHGLAACLAGLLAYLASNMKLFKPPR